MLRKQVVALAQEELTKNMKIDGRSIQTMSTNLFPNDRRQTNRKLDITLTEQRNLNETKWKDVKDFFSFSYGYGGMICLFILCLLTAIS